MTKENAIRMLIAMVKCIDLEVSGTTRSCNNNQCDICRLNYEKGTIGEQKECFKMAIKALQTDIAMDFITLSEKLQHELEEQDETINCLQDENKKLHAELSDSKNDLQQAVNEIKLLNKQIDKLIAENNDLRLRRKMFTKTLLNQLYGSCYVDTDSIKETKDNDNNY